MKPIFFFACVIGSSCALQNPVPVAANPAAKAPTRSQSNGPTEAHPSPGNVRAVEFSRDFKWLAVGTFRVRDSTDGIVTIRQVATNRVVRTWTLGGGVKFLAFSPDGNALAVAGVGGKLSLWNWKTGRLLHSQTLNTDDDPDRMSLAFSPDGHTLAVGVRNITLLDTKSWRGRKLLAYSVPFDVVGHVVFSPNGGQLLASDNFEGNRGYSLVSLKKRKARSTPGFIAMSAPVFSRNGRFFAGGAQKFYREPPSAAFVWDARTLKIKRTFESERFQPQAFSPDARFVAGIADEGDYEGRVEIWSVSSGKRVRVFQQSARRVVWPHSATLLVGDETGVRRVRVRK